MRFKKYFGQVVVISLGRRWDRWKLFVRELPEDWPFESPIRFRAIDGQKCRPPASWRQGGGAWGCYRSHLRLVERCLNDGVDSILLLEDDAVFPADFTQRIQIFLENVPEDWDMLYLGGQHLHAREHPPIEVNDHVYQPYNVNRTHAWAIRGKMLETVYHHLLRTDWEAHDHIDHHMGRLHQLRQHRIYCPREWLVGQAEGRSDISHRRAPTRFWPSAAYVTTAKPESEPFVAVIGLHSSGSSCAAGVMHHLGVHMGNQLGGYYGNDPDRTCGFEASGLARICEWAIPFPATELAHPPESIQQRLSRWIHDRRGEAFERSTLAGGKYPQLCRLGQPLKEICGGDLKIVHIDRPLDESISSLIRRSGRKFDADLLATHQRWLWAGKTELLAAVPHLTVKYADLLSDPSAEIARIVEYLDIEPTPVQVAKAMQYVRPEMRHVSLDSASPSAA
jgi:GR25 family glycosyltransferase involved in LPS biosynthesis